VKAVVYERYGLPDVLRVEDVSMPSPSAGQVLVKGRGGVGESQ
jgi:NADPH:quinone reductase-like Zn-dependent oxidoreductase